MGGATPRYVAGTQKYRCEQCGAKVKSNYERLQWDRARVCPRCWDSRNGQELGRARRDPSPPPWTNPPPPPNGTSRTTRVIDSAMVSRITIG